MVSDDLSMSTSQTTMATSWIFKSQYLFYSKVNYRMLRSLFGEPHSCLNFLTICISYYTQHAHTHSHLEPWAVLMMQAYDAAQLCCAVHGARRTRHPTSTKQLLAIV